MLTSYTDRVIGVAMLTVAALIEILTPAALGKALGISVQAISNMKQRGAIPPRHWPEVARLTAEIAGYEKFNVSDLVAMHTRGGNSAHRESGAENHPRRRAGAGAR